MNLFHSEFPNSDLRIDKGGRKVEGYSSPVQVAAVAEVPLLAPIQRDGPFSHGAHVANSTSSVFEPQSDGDDSDDGESFYPTIVDEGGSSYDQVPAQRDELDLAYSIKGMYRILDLFSEQSSAGGLVDKIIISQKSLEAFINSVCPGAYSSMTKVNFRSLDDFVIKPVGIYGSRDDIVRFLSRLGAIDETIAGQLLVHSDLQTRTQPTLRSGLYIVTSQEETGVSHRIFVLYWPEETTWDDAASSPVRRNRITFMRYLTKMCDQLVSLISSEHAQTIVWNEEVDEATNDDDVFDIDLGEPHRMFAFEVEETNQQEESVSVREGFKAVSKDLVLSEASVQGPDPMNPSVPFLLFGETTQGFMTVEYREGRGIQEKFRLRAIEPLLLDTYLTSDRLRLSAKLDDEAMWILLRFGLGKRFLQRCRVWNDEYTLVQKMSDMSASTDINDVLEKLGTELPALEMSLFEAILDEVLRLYPCFDRGAFTYPGNGKGRSGSKPEPISNILALYPKTRDKVTQQLSKDFQNIFDRDYGNAKDRICVFKELSLLFETNDLGLDKETRLRFLGAVLDGGAEPKGNSGTSEPGTLLKWLAGFREVLCSLSGESGMVEDLVRRATQAAKQTSDSQFLSRIERDKLEYAKHFPRFVCLANLAKQKALECLKTSIARTLAKLTPAVQELQQDECGGRIKHEHKKRAEEEQDRLRVNLIKDINDLSAQSTTSKYTLCIDSAVEVPQKYGSSSYRISGARLSHQDPMAVYTVHLMELTTQDQHELRLNSKAIPAPRFKFSHKFTLPLAHSVVRAQLLQGEKLLLVVADRAGNLSVYLERLAAMDDAIARRRAKRLNHERIGEKFLLAYDELKKMLAIVSSDKLLLYILAFDDIRGFQAVGSAISLYAWYTEGVSIRHACFVSGSEELLLIDSEARGRVFSLETLQFRPATLQLDQVPYGVSSTPDGACLLVAQAREGGLTVTACHWSAFGSTEGIPLDLGPIAVENGLVVTSLVSRSAVHVVTLDFEARACKSHALDITCKTTEFTFQQKGASRFSRRYGAGAGPTTAHNCLVDCFADVWTRFPVLPAVQRETISSSSLRSARMLIFVTDRDHTRYASHFAQMIKRFERETKKPTGNMLKSIQISAVTFSAFVAESSGDAGHKNGLWSISAYRAGEWLVDFLCLIPIHLAVAKENQFVPLKDGVYSPELEKSLLGADVNRIVDNLSFGWYESLFQSYMASKPVRVVSSMGEQSVGKSFSLNHLVDTSFAGSAMRTTEGVWMSVTPTKDGLVVALDFEGVHSIERSAQEDMLLVLFNTAISNLVLFRNNFALSRDITGLFQSFQSSSTVLDPKANPSLFQSTLVIIIKDVVEADMDEIAREFSLKFQRIVHDEREANFISRLHAGKLNIIPWPVIESREFYRLFPALKRRLDQQPVTHPSAGGFLHLMKTLMAKLKANDWGAMSQNMASHRAQLISMLLVNALTYGYAELDPELEPLKNLDTDMPIERPDTLHQLFIGGGENESASRERMLTALRMSWEGHASRQSISEDKWVTGLTKHLENIVDLRIAHVNEWMDQNLARFQPSSSGSSHACIDDLKRLFEGSIVDLRGSVQLCGLTCMECHLRCVQSRLHEGAHDCQSDHLCVHECDFCLALEPEEYQSCAMRAGHAGKHICAVNQHLCGKSCKLSGRRGCLDVCAKVVDHPDVEHLCAAPVHACGKPCDLSDVPLVGGSVYSCTGKCSIPSDTVHSLHRCDARFCLIQCQLCKRLCADQDHMHGLDSSAIHLCGQEHFCTALCAAPGICDISTEPHSIEATFTGRNETFQYTKYSQVARRLKCIKPIPPGATKHTGAHNHTLDKDVTHFCEKKCDNCGYFCKLSLGHLQREHETHHGSMAHTRWTIDGLDDVALEIQGRKFSTNDEGAPMMCNLVCSAMGRHVHIDYCRAGDMTKCTGNEGVQHLIKKLQPNPERPKDLITHNLFWKRSGFKDPYSKEEQTNFAKCDAMCRGREHVAANGGPAKPSYCILPLFHAPLSAKTPLVGAGYISQDGHQFACKKPTVKQQAFHVIFVADRSYSMSTNDRKPLPNTPATAQISASADNRYGAVLSSLHCFWTARATRIANLKFATRKDAYSVILFNDTVHTPVTNDFASTPDQLLNAVLNVTPDDGTDFTLAIQEAQQVMEDNWNPKRSPVIIFLSDGECEIDDKTMHDLCRTAVQLGKAVSFHAVAFGPNASSTSLHRMVEIALNVQTNAPVDPVAPTTATVLSSYTQASDTTQLAETFLNIAESLRKPRGGLMH